MTRNPGKLGRKKSIVSIGLVGILLGVGVWGVLRGTFHGANADNASQASTSGIALTTPVSPLIFGTNMGLFNSYDQVLNSATTRSLLQQIHVQIMRMPVRSSLSEATEVQAAQIIKSLGAIPLVALRGEVDPNVVADDTTIINGMNSVFGNSIVYYEYGNEEDLAGVSVDKYTSSWNAVIPKLKQIALNGQFIGPVNFQYSPTYLTAFLQNANPRPDEVSWHEYTCDDSWSSNDCISRIDRWTNHISGARAAMTAAIGTALPIMITEWNYAPNPVSNDGKNNDSTFMSTWTSKALQTLAANRVFASMQYSCTNTIPLIDRSGSLTVQGKTFQAVYEQMIVGGQQPTPAPTATVAPTAAVAPVPTQTQPTADPTRNDPLPQPTIALNNQHAFGTVLGRDTFQRANQALWGTASDRQTWGGSANIKTIFSISGNAGLVSNTGPTTYSAVLGSTASNAEVYATGSMSSFSSSNFGDVLRWTDGNNWYKAYIDGSSLFIQKKVNGVTTILASVPFSATAGISYTIHFRVVGSTLTANVWASSGSEPSGWVVTGSDSTFSSGYCGMRFLTQTGTATVTSFQAKSL